MSPKRAPVSIDSLEIDFGAAPPPRSTQPSTNVAAELLADLVAQDGEKRDVEVRAFDPSLQTYVARSNAATVGRRRRTLFGGAPAAAPSGAVVAPATPALEERTRPQPKTLPASTVAAAEAFLEEELGPPQQGPALLAAKHAAYQASLRHFCQQGLPWAASLAPKGAPPRPTSPTSGASLTASASASPVFPRGPTQCNSLLHQLFASGVPDIEPWDRWAFKAPQYDNRMMTVVAARPASITDVMDLVHHPVLRDTHYTRYYQHAAAAAPVEAKLMKTKDELREERRERLKRKQEQARQNRAAAKASGETTAAPADRLAKHNLAFNLFSGSVLNPVGADTKVLDQYQQRFLEHQRRNYERHIAALPDQIAKRERDAIRHAEERPVLRAYRLHPLYSAPHLGKLRNFSNDSRLRGAILWVGGCDAVVVLSGGEVAMRHLHHWIMHKMRWEHGETRATYLCSVPLMAAQSISFHRTRVRPVDAAAKRAKNEGGAESAVKDRVSGEEPVFMNFCDTVAEGEAFLRSLPAPGGPWKDLTAVWRLAFLRDGLSQ